MSVCCNDNFFSFASKLATSSIEDISIGRRGLCSLNKKKKKKENEKKTKKKLATLRAATLVCACGCSSVKKISESFFRSLNENNNKRNGQTS